MIPRLREANALIHGQDGMTNRGVMQRFYYNFSFALKLTIIKEGVGADQMIARPVPGGRKVRAPQGRMVGNGDWRRREGKCHRKDTACSSDG